MGLIDDIEQDLDEAPAVVPADAGYRSESCLEELELHQIDAYVSLGWEGSTTMSAPEYQLPTRRPYNQVRNRFGCNLSFMTIQTVTKTFYDADS